MPTHVRAITEGVSERETKEELEGGHEPPNTQYAVALEDKRCLQERFFLARKKTQNYTIST